MKIDIVTKEILLEVQKEIKEEFGEEYSIQEITNIVESQFVISNLAFKKGIEVRLPRFGTFIRKFGFEYGKAGKALLELKSTMTEEEFKERVKALKMRHKELKKIRIANRKVITLKDLATIKDKVNVLNVYDKLL